MRISKSLFISLICLGLIALVIVFYMGYLDRGVSKSNSIYIRSYPTSASVFLNDNSIGKTPVFVQNLKDQRIIIKLSLKPYPEVIDTIDLNDPASVSYTHLTLPTIYSV